MNAFRYFVAKYPTQSLTVLLCLVLASAMEGVGLTTLLPVLGMVASGDGADGSERKMSELEQTAQGVMASLGIDPSLGQLLAFLAIVFWLKAGVVLLASRQVGYTVARVATDLRIQLLRSLTAARWSHFTRLPAGSAANALATEAERASLAYKWMTQTVGYALETALYLLLALAISWQVTAGAAATTVFTFASLGVLVRISDRAGLKQTKSLKNLLSRATDSLQAAKLLKATGRESLIGPLLERETERLNKALRRRVLSSGALIALQEPIIFSAGAIGIFIAKALLDMQLAETLLLTGLFLRTIACSNKMQRRYQTMRAESSALDSLRDMIDRAETALEPMLGDREPTLDQQIELRDVCVRFDGSEVLNGLSMSIPVGQVTAVIGGSGAGKTTAVDVVLGLIRPDVGDVYIDGVAMREIDLRRWRRWVGYVPQEVLMLHDSVERNVGLGDPELKSADIEQALRDAGAWEFVSALPEGVESSVGERGLLLSGGQRQRIAIARALVHGAKLLILDEATASLDPDSEADVWAAVERLRGRTTVLAISHQPALAGIADRIYRVEGGRATLVDPAAARDQLAS